MTSSDEDKAAGRPEPPATDRGQDIEVVHGEHGGSASYQVAGEVIHQSVSFRQAPYPTPEDLREYEAVHPGFTDRILTLTEKETQHRIELERLQDNSSVELAKRGQIFAFVVVMTLVVGGIAAILSGHSIVGFAGLVLAAATLAGAFVAPAIAARRSSRRGEDLGANEVDRQLDPTELDKGEPQR